MRGRVAGVVVRIRLEEWEGVISVICMPSAEGCCNRNPFMIKIGGS